MDIFLSHDWPRGIYNHGNTQSLFQQKEYFVEEIKQNTLGSVAAEDVLNTIKPEFWFSGHLHVKFPAVVNHKVRTIK